MGLIIRKAGDKTKTTQLGNIGVPGDGLWLDGYFNWADGTSISDAIDDVNELLKAINTRIVSTETLVSSHTTSISNNTTSIGTLNTNVSSILTRLGTVESNISTLTTNVSSNTTKIGTLETSVGTINTSISSLNTRVNTLESLIGGGGEVDLSGILQSITDINEDIAGINTLIGTINTNISNLNTRVGAVEEDISNISLDVSTLKTDVANINIHLGTLDQDIVDINERIDNLPTGGEGGTPNLGAPTDGSWTDGFFDSWTTATLIKDALDNISEAFLDLAPAKAGVLTSITLTSNLTVYSGKLAAGLNAAWYSGGKVAGDAVSTYAVTHSVILTTPNASTIFRAGKKNTPSSYGTLKLLKNGVEDSSYDMSAGIGGNTTLHVTAIDVYNNMWAKANANATITLVDEGRQTYLVSHTEAGSTNQYEVYHDPSKGSLAFVEPLVLSVTTPVYKYLSGKQYITLGTVINAKYKAASGIFNKVYHSSSVSVLSGTGFSNITINPVSVPNYLDEFPVDQNITINSANQASNTPSVTANLYRPETNINTSGNITGYRLCTYGTMSTATSDDFYDEARRLIVNTSTAFDSTVSLANGEAQVKNGSLVYGLDDYPSKTGAQEYNRLITKASASGGTITFTGINYTDVAAYGTGNVNVLIQLDGTAKVFDCGRPYGSNNGDGSGISYANSIGCKVDGSGGALNFTLGTNSTAGLNNNTYKLIIIFNNNTKSITKIATS